MFIVCSAKKALFCRSRRVVPAATSFRAMHPISTPSLCVFRPSLFESNRPVRRRIQGRILQWEHLLRVVSDALLTLQCSNGPETSFDGLFDSLGRCMDYKRLIVAGLFVELPVRMYSITAVYSANVPSLEHVLACMSGSSQICHTVCGPPAQQKSRLPH